MNKLVFNTGKLIKYKRKVKGYSTQELAKLLDVSPGLINHIENAKTDTFNLELLYKVSSTLDIPVTDIISYSLDNLFNSNIDASTLYSSFNIQIGELLKSLIQLSNNENWSSSKMDMLIKKLIDDINFHNKISSFLSK